MPTNFEITCSRGFPDWLMEQRVSLGVTTYQGNRLLLIGLKPDGRLSVFQRIFQRCMGLHVVDAMRPIQRDVLSQSLCDTLRAFSDGRECADSAWHHALPVGQGVPPELQGTTLGLQSEARPAQTLWMTSQCQIWRFENMLGDGQNFEGCDRSFAPQQAYYTGDVDAHDIATEASGRVLFVSTLLSCIATVSDRYSLEPVWKPPFVSKLAAEDRCHLNGMALEDGKLKYVTACGKTNSFDGWRDVRDTGGCVIDVESGEAVVSGLSMPHSPRVKDGRLWVLNSGHGKFGYVDRQAGRFEPVADCSGYARGLSFSGDWAVVGTSLPRHEPTFRGLPMEQTQGGVGARCGLQIVSLSRGEVAHWVRIEGDIRELYDVVVLPGVKRPRAAGVLDDEVNHNIWFRDFDGSHRSWTASPKT